MAKPSLDWVVVGFLGLAATLLLTGLDNGLLWQDEAETAVLARNTLAFGYPRAFDGRSYVEAYTGYGPGQAWIYSPWLPLYLLAGVFAVAGESTAVARMPFALIGWLSVYLAWRLARRLTTDRTVQRLTLALLVCSVPFLLHMRQCRYYSMTTALLLGVCLAYLSVVKRPSHRRGLVLGLLLGALFHTNFGLVLPVAAALAIHQWRWGSPTARTCLLTSAAAAAVLSVPWAVFFYRPGVFSGALTLDRLGDHLEYYVRVTNKYLVPLAAMSLLSGTWRLLQRRPLPLRRWWRSCSSGERFAIVLIAVYALFLLLPDQRHMRYLIPVLPVLLFFEARWLAAWVTRWRVAGWALAALALLTNVLQSPHARIPLADFSYELTHAYRGPMEGIVAYLREHGESGQTVKIPYDDRTLMFYTQMTVERPTQFLQESYPEWVVIRRDWIPGEFFRSDYVQRIEATYDRIDVDAPDILWQNREDPGSHHFRTVRDAPRVVIYRKRVTQGRGRLG